jgi:hypothetical protein
VALGRIASDTARRKKAARGRAMLKEISQAFAEAIDPFKVTKCDLERGPTAN